MITTLYLTYIFLGIALLSSFTLYFQPIQQIYLKLFPFFLFSIGILSAIIGYLFFKGKSNVFFYNIYTTLEFCFYFFVMSQIILNRKIKRIIYFFLYAYPIVEIVNIFFIQKTTTFTNVTYSIGCLLIVLSSIWYFFELFQLSYTINLLTDSNFWVCSGLMFYYVCNFPIFSLLNFLKTPSTIIVINVTIITNILDVLLYTSFTIAFLCRLKI